MRTLFGSIARTVLGGAYVVVFVAHLSDLHTGIAFGEDVDSDADANWPKSVAELLLQGLSKNDTDSLQIWKECHKSLVRKGEDACRADVALALIYAQAGRYSDMRTTLMRAAESNPKDPELLRLLSWARLSDRQFTQGLQEVTSLVKTQLIMDSTSESSDVNDAIHFAGEAFGFAEIAIKEVQPAKQEQYEELRKDLHNLLPDAAKTSFAYAEDHMRNKVEQAIQKTRGEQAENSAEQMEKKAATEQALGAQQRTMQEEAASRQQQAAQIQQNAQSILAEIAYQAQPCFASKIRLESQLCSLLTAQAREIETFDKQRFDPLIADVRGQLTGVLANLGPLIARYNQVEQVAMGQLRALGVRVQQLGRIHGANERRLQANAAERATGLTVKVSKELRMLTRFATYVPLDFERETQYVVGNSHRRGLTVDR